MRRAGGWFLAMALAGGLTLACFGPAASDGRQLAYRDFSDFYYPLYQRVQQEWRAGRLPLWSPEENGGSPILGNPTAAVLYPGKLIYAALPYPRAAKAYVVAHVLLAFGSMIALLRGFGVSRPGSTLGGLAFAFGAPVLTQYSNVVFLVGAAWMPLGFRFADSWARGRSPRALAGLALVLAMQVLGGDPEAAYLTGFAASAYLAGRGVVDKAPWRSRRIALAGIGLAVAFAGLLALEVDALPAATNRAIPGPFARPWWRPSPVAASLAAWGVAGLVGLVMAWKRGRSSFAGGLLGLVGAGLLGAALAGAQLLPTLEFVAQSTRVGDAPHHDVYAHSTNPARLAEWAWPGVFGSTAHRDRKWLAALPPTRDHRIWMTSLYPGALTLLLACGSVGFRGPGSARGWMIGVALVGVLAGFGTFGSPLFWARAASGDARTLGALEEPEPPLPRPDGLLRDGDGGPYWFLATALPGFRSFRYPGKLFIPAALGMAALAGMGLDGLIAGRRRLAEVLAWALLTAGLVGLALSLVGSKALLAFLSTRAEAATSVFGPFDPDGALRDLRSGLAQGSAVIAAFLVLARVAPRRPRLAAALAMGLMAVDLATANRGEVGTVAQLAYDADSKVLAAIRQSERDHPGGGPFRVFRLHGWVPVAWNRVASADRLGQIVRWERETLRPKYELPLGVASTFAYGTTERAELGPFFEPFPVAPDPAMARALGLAPGPSVNYYPRRGFDLWNTRYFIVPTRLAWGSRARGFASFLPESESIYPPPFADREGRERWGLEEDVQVFRNLAAYPRAWVIHRAIPVHSPRGVSAEDRRRVMTSLLYQDDELWQVEGRGVVDPRRVAYVEAPAEKLVGLGGATVGPERVEVVAGADPTRVEVEVDLQALGLVVLAETFDPGWRLEVDGKPAEVFRTNQTMRGAIVPAGKHRLVYAYRPSSLTLGLGLSASGLLAWAALVAFGGNKRQLPGQDSNLEKQDQNLL